MSDWSAAVRRPPAHRVSGQKECQTLTRITIGISVVLIALFIALLTGLPNDHDCAYTTNGQAPPYNATYPLSPATKTAQGLLYKIAVITDLDTENQLEGEKHTWYSYFRRGSLLLSSDSSKARVEWNRETKKIKSTLSQGGRGMELSDLKVFDGHLLTVDDRTGVVYRIDLEADRMIPWIVVPDGSGNESKGFKGEWLAVKDRNLYVGGLGKEWTTIYGEFRNLNPMWTKIVSHTGYVRHENWIETYKKIRNAAGIKYPGYMIHESAQWSDIHKKWFFLPRRASTEIYTEAADERRDPSIKSRRDALMKIFSPFTGGCSRSCQAWYSISFHDCDQKWEGVYRQFQRCPFPSVISQHKLFLFGLN